MKFQNLISFFRFVQQSSIAELNNLVGDYLNLQELLIDINECEVSEELLLSICRKLKGMKIEEAFWYSTVFLISTNSLTESFLDYLIDNNLAIIELGHLSLPDKDLWKLVNRVDEAVLTLGKRYYNNDDYSLEEFDIFIKRFSTNHWLWSSLLDIDTEPFNKKRKLLVRNLFLNTNFEDLKKILIEDNIARYLEKTTRIEMIKKYYLTYNFKYFKAIAANPITPIYILNTLTGIRDVKYAKQIRTRAMNNLKNQNNNSEP